MFYHYTARSGTGATTSGVLESDSATSVRQHLRERDLFPLSITAGRAGVRERGKFKAPTWSWGIGRSDLLMLTSQLSLMCRTGMDLAEALQIAASHCRNPAMKECLDSIYRDVAGGKPVSAALRRHAHVFGDAYVASIAAAEASGRVTEVLARLAELIRNEMRLRTAMRSLLAYPIVLIGVSSVVMGAVVFFVLPQFAKVFEEMQVPAPPLTRALMTAATWLRSQAIPLAAIGALAAVAAVRLRSHSAFRQVWDGFLLNGIIVRDVTRSLFVGRSFRLLGTMLESGVPLLDGIRMCRSAIRNVHGKGLFDDLEEDVVNGRGLASAVMDCRFVPSGAVQMILTAEKTGKLGTVMQSVGEFYEDDGERRLRDLTKLLEPTIIVMLGAVVALIVAAVMLPLLDFSSAR